jgi:hypothetical protein
MSPFAPNWAAAHLTGFCYLSVIVNGTSGTAMCYDGAELGTFDGGTSVGLLPNCWETVVSKEKKCPSAPVEQ